MTIQSVEQITKTIYASDGSTYTGDEPRHVSMTQYNVGDHREG